MRKFFTPIFKGHRKGTNNSELRKITMDFQEKIERIAFVVIAFLCIAISILDFFDALDSIPWLSQRIPIMILLATGLIALYNIAERNRTFNNLEKIITTGQSNILSKISMDETNRQIVDSVKNLWAEREDDIQLFFEKLEKEKSIKDHSSLRAYLENCQSKFYSGDIFGTRLDFPWDIEITAVNLKGDFIYHPEKDMISVRSTHIGPYQSIVEKRKGEIFWPSRGKSFRLAAIFPYKYFLPQRFTKVYFRELKHVEAIVVFESHVSVIYSLPKLSNEKS